MAPTIYHTAGGRYVAWKVTRMCVPVLLVEETVTSKSLTLGTLSSHQFTLEHERNREVGPLGPRGRRTR